MIHRLRVIWNSVFAPRSWDHFGDPATGEWKMRRWTAGRWEFREMTDDELAEARSWQANK